jgi:KaiC/GvpD/RAD55 family RecA-like ATPase
MKAKQQLLVEYLLSSTDLFAMCHPIVKPDYFVPELKPVVKFIQQYYETYKGLPSVEQITAETEVSVATHTITGDKFEYCTNEIEGFCKQKAIEKALINSVELMKKGDYGQIEEKLKTAISISLNRDLGLVYFDDPEERLIRQLETVKPIPTLWKEFDELLYGGLLRKELILFSASSGGGKSITLKNLALNFLLQDLNVLYITLELSEDLVGRRFDTMISGVSSAIWRDHIDEIASKVSKFKVSSKQRLVIKYMPSGTKAYEIRAYLKEYQLQYGHMPDLLCVDYLDLMAPNRQVSADNVFEKDKQCSEQLRNLLNEFNMVGATASQLNRSAVDADTHSHAHIAGGISKINTADVYVSIHLTNAMKAAGDIGFQFEKTRNSDGAGKIIYTGWNNKTLRIWDPKEENDTKAIASKIEQKKQERVQNNIIPGTPKRSLLDIVDI